MTIKIHYCSDIGLIIWSVMTALRMLYKFAQYKLQRSPRYRRGFLV
jgi:hypothetical protein